MDAATVLLTTSFAVTWALGCPCWGHSSSVQQGTVGRLVGKGRSVGKGRHTSPYISTPTPAWGWVYQSGCTSLDKMKGAFLSSPPVWPNYQPAPTPPQWLGTDWLMPHLSIFHFPWLFSLTAGTTHGHAGMARAALLLEWHLRTVEETGSIAKHSFCFWEDVNK